MRLPPEQIARQYYDLFNRRALEESQRLIDPEALFHYPALTQHVVGPAGHRALSQMWLTAFPDLRLSIRRLRMVAADVVQLESTARGSHQGPLTLGDVKLPATHCKVDIPFRHTFTVRAGKLTHIRLDLDIDQLLRQLHPQERG